MAPAKAEIERRKREVVDRVGPWFSHNIHLGEGVFTIGESANSQEVRLPFVVQLATDLIGPLEGKRILDVACMEGMFAIELASRGAEVLGIEGRPEHVERALFAKEMLGLANVDFVCDDVRNLGRGQRDEYDLVLLLGIAYHLGEQDVADLMRAAARISRRAAIVDTHYSLEPAEHFEAHGSEYWGRRVREHDPADAPDERRQAPGSSLDNAESVWLTKPSLFNLLGDSGFTSVYEVRLPRAPYGNWDRTILAALCGVPQAEMLSAPQLPPTEPLRYGENEGVRESRQQSTRGRVERRLAAAMPAPLRRGLAGRRRRRR
jgi:SAM-dependent methyltransferase